MFRFLSLNLLLNLALVFVNAQIFAAEIDTTQTKKIAIIIDDLGYKKSEGEAVIDLDIDLSVAVLPYTQHGKYLANYAHKNNVEVMLHLPMQPSANEKLMTENTLSINMNKEKFIQVVTAALNEIPHIQGVNNHMGSLFTQLPAQMGWLMESLDSFPKQLFFVDSFTSNSSIAFQIAESHSIPNTKRDVFLDRELTEAHMEAQIKKLKQVADKNGHVVVIGHPFTETINLLKKHIPKLKEQGYEFVKVSSLIRPNKTRTVNTLDQNESSKFKTIH